MAEREALEREIEQLQNLIKDHKRVHGNAPTSSTSWFSSGRGMGRGRGHNLRYTHSSTQSGLAQPYKTHSSWRKNYSLNNTTTKTPMGGPSHVSEPHVNKTQHVSPGVLPSKVAKAKVSTLSLQKSPVKDSFPSVDGVPASSVSSANRTVLKPARSKAETEFKSDAGMAGSLVTSGPVSKSDSKTSQKAASKKALEMVCDTATSSVPSSEHPTCALNSKKISALQVKPHSTSSVSTNRTVIMATSAKDCSSTQTVPPKTSSSPASNLTFKLDSIAQATAKSSPHKTSQFTWVKSQGTKNSHPKPSTHSGFPNSATAPTAIGSANIKQVHGSNKKVPRRPTLSSGPPKTSKYSWVSSSCSSAIVAKVPSAKLPNKQLSPKTLKISGKATKEGLDGTKKLTSPTTSKRTKVIGGTSSPHVSHTSRYCWKAASQNPSTVSSVSTPRSSQKGSVYRWTAQKEGKNSGLGMLSSQVQRSPSTTPPSNRGFKLRSRTKIIRRCSSSNAVPERRSSVSVVTVRSRYSLRRKTHTSMKTQIGSRRVQSRALVSFGRHKLRRLSPSTPTTAAWSQRTGFPSSSHRSSASQRVIKTRYKIDTRRSHFQHHNPALSYRVKRIQSARFLLQSRLRTPPDHRQWRGRGMRWIGGALYRVSANKLSRTHPTSTSSVRSGKWFSPQETSSPSSLVRTSNIRHVASRAVQRSLAIIRQSRQKKQQAKQYCMYYNRFGKCNRGSACPYIHDPDKVAVCTRFLRGTCKQTDGTCPFSHKVSKEKMPVCSYFLKGICNNSNCPYSHVYVSRKAAVCQDFIRGYCPQGEKCKKKHTLVCPEFSSTGVCPRGSKCKLQHRQRAKRSGSSHNTGPTKKAHTIDTTNRPEPSLTKSPQADKITPTLTPAKLPSFISLSSSPETTDSSPCPPAAATEATGKKLHIKPRF